MFTFKIGGAAEALQLINKNWPTKTVTVIQESADWEEVNDTHIVVHMDDVGSLHLSPMAPTRAHLERILSHTADLKDNDRLLVNCWAGQSRSTAACIGILIQHGCDPKTALELVLKERNIALPNSLLIQHIDDHFKLNGELVAIVAAHRKSELAKPYQQMTAAESIADMKRLMGLID
jgi:predicted protein tyrosine phosphatase